MSGFDFFVDLMVTGTVLGLDDTSEIETELLAALSKQGVQLEELPYHDEDYVELTLTDTERQTWYDRRDPQENRADWWRCLSHAAAGKTGGTDDAVARWLATLPASPAGADIATARLLRDQIHDVQRGLGLLTDPGLAEELRRWMAVKPLLLADRPTG
jgi:hypothetical protein